MLTAKPNLIRLRARYFEPQYFPSDSAENSESYKVVKQKAMVSIDLDTYKTGEPMRPFDAQDLPRLLDIIKMPKGELF
jgi:hypothetical protein